MRALPVVLVAMSAWAGQKPTISYQPPAQDDDARPVLTSLIVGPQGTDYALKLEFNKEPWGDACKTRCANATVFLDTDNNKTTGLKLSDAKAAETGTDLAIVIQGGKGSFEGGKGLKVKVLQYGEDARSVEEAQTLAELTPSTDPERVLSSGTSVYLLIDANLGSQPAGAKLRVVYHPPESKALEAVTKGLASPASGRVELFKDGKLTNPPQKKKSDYEKL